MQVEASKQQTDRTAKFPLTFRLGSTSERRQYGGDHGGKVSILGAHNISHSKKKK
jgi:hypothetical protein